MRCFEWTRLFEIRENVAQEYNQAIDGACGLDHPEFDEAMCKLQAAKGALEAAEKALRDHERGHRCLHRRPDIYSKASA